MIHLRRGKEWASIQLKGLANRIFTGGKLMTESNEGTYKSVKSQLKDHPDFSVAYRNEQGMTHVYRTLAFDQAHAERITKVMRPNCEHIYAVLGRPHDLVDIINIHDFSQATNSEVEAWVDYVRSYYDPTYPGGAIIPIDGLTMPMIVCACAEVSHRPHFEGDTVDRENVLKVLKEKTNLSTLKDWMFTIEEVHAHIERISKL